MKLHTGIIALAVMTGVCWGQNEGGEIADRVMAHYKSLPGARVSLSMEFEAGDSPMAAMLEQFKQTTHGYAVRPNQFAFWAAEGGGAMMGMSSLRVWCDGEQMISASPDQGIYSVEEAPAGFAELRPDENTGMMPDSAVQMIPGADLLLQLMAEDPAETIGEMLGGAEFLGRQEGEDGPYWAFHTSGDSPLAEGMEMDVYIAAEGDPWVIGLKPDLGDQAEMLGDVSMLMRLTGWESIEAAPEGEGRIEIAEDWEKTDNLVEALLGAMMAGGGDDAFGDMEIDEPEAPETGEAAATFTLDKLGGGEFSLASQQGKVVVLDFWATWCGPCVAGLPTVSSVTGEYAGKGVVFAAVNLQEDPEHVAEFMKKKGWEFTVLLDGDGAVAGEYGVTGIPHSVIIDKKGVIRHVEIGFGGAEAAEKMLRENLDALLKE